MDKENYYEQFYRVLEETLLEEVRPKMGLSLSGGLDTRVIAATLTKNNVRVPVLTSPRYKIEALIASMVAHKLGLDLYYFPYNNGDLANFGLEYMLMGTGFDELCGSWRGIYAKNYSEFKEAQRKHVEPLMVYINHRNRFTEVKYIEPFISSKVVTVFNSIPWQYVKGKQIQRWILKTKFSILWKIPYYNSLLPNPFPIELHMLVNKLHKVTWRALLGHIPLKEAVKVYGK